MDASIQELMEKLPAAFMPEKAQGIDATVLFQLGGEKGGNWVVTIHNGSCQVRPGTTENPKLVFTADAQDCLDIFYDKLDGMKAYMQGRLKLSGNMGLAMRLAGLFSLDEYKKNKAMGS